MRVSAPDLLKIKRSELLRDVKERLKDRMPDLESVLDAGHPAWLLLEEAAWMVESLSEQLDDYPWAVVQQFAHLLGTQLEPAQPAIGVAVVRALTSGVLQMDDNPGRWRFFSPQSESHGLVEFVPAEDHIPVVNGVLAGLAVIRDGELWRARPEVADDAALPEQAAWLVEGPRSRVFERESFRFAVRGADLARVETELGEAIATFDKDRPLGWLRLRVEKPDKNSLEVVATIDVNRAFEGAGEADGSDLEGIWGTLDGAPWTPEVRVADHPLLPRRLRGARPLLTEDGLMVSDVPSNMLTNELLEREARPAPAEVAAAIWTTLTHVDRRLSALRPKITRGIDESVPELAWVDGVLRSGGWARVAEHVEMTLAYVTLQRASTKVRLAVVHPTGSDPSFSVHGFAENGALLPEDLKHSVAWRVDLPDSDGRGTVRTSTISVDVPAGCRRLLLTASGTIRGVQLNPILLINAPLVRDGRRIAVSRAVPEPVSLLHGDIVTRGVLDRLVLGGMHRDAAAVVKALRLAEFSVEEQRPIVDFEGLGVDAVEGTITLNAPDPLGQMRKLRRSDRLKLEWYRRTSASGGNVEPGAIALVEQGPTARPRLTGVSNPLATVWGADRERDEDAIARVFGPQMGVPVIAADWERLIRQALGKRATGWVVRVWGYSERTLVSNTLWPPHSSEPAHPARVRLEAELASAGPDALLVVLGPDNRVIDEDEVEICRQAISALVARWEERIPTIRSAVVTAFWPLNLRGDGPGPLPRFSLRDFRGVLSDPQGARIDVPNTTLLLNAAVVEVSE